MPLPKQSRMPAICIISGSMVTIALLLVIFYLIWGEWMENRVLLVVVVDDKSRCALTYQNSYRTGAAISPSAIHNYPIIHDDMKQKTFGANHSSM